MPRRPGVEAVLGERVGAGEQTEAVRLDDEVKVGGATAHRAVALHRLDRGRGVDLEAHAAAVAAALVRHHAGRTASHCASTFRR